MRSKQLVILSVFCLLLVLASCGKPDASEIAEVIGTDKMTTSTYYGSYIINENDINEIASYSNYIFVGRVEDYIKTEYISDDDELPPVTYYSVGVLKNIKGELTTDENVVLTKSGGIKKDGKTFAVEVNDILPALGNTYVFAATLYNDELYCFCPNMVALIEESSDIEESSLYKKYTEAADSKLEDIEPVEGISRFDVSEKN